MAPELFRGEACSLESDVYAFAVTLWEIFSADTPFAGCSQISEIKDKVLHPSESGFKTANAGSLAQCALQSSCAHVNQQPKGSTLY